MVKLLRALIASLLYGKNHDNETKANYHTRIHTKILGKSEGKKSLGEHPHQSTICLY